jgi:hypothetical protein
MSSEEVIKKIRGPIRFIRIFTEPFEFTINRKNYKSRAVFALNFPNFPAFAFIENDQQYDQNIISLVQQAFFSNKEVEIEYATKKSSKVKKQESDEPIDTTFAICRSIAVHWSG